MADPAIVSTEFIQSAAAGGVEGLETNGMWESHHEPFRTPHLSA
jgi:hypothetical protein